MRALILAFLLLAATVHAQDFVSLKETIRIAKSTALRASSVDWRLTEIEALQLAQSKGEDAAIRFVLKALADGHSFYRTPRREIAVLAPDVNGVPIVEINSWTGTEEEGRTATKMVRNVLESALKSQQCGVVLDFSRNQGGNMWPMLAGLAPLLSEGRLGGFRGSAGSSTLIENRGGIIFLAGKASLMNIPVSLDIQPKAIAIVLGPQSASSGEIVPIMFKGQANVRFFGTLSAGLTTSNSSHTLPNGGMIAVTTGVTLDRTLTAYEGKLLPDTETEKGVEAGAAWVAERCLIKD